MKFLLSNFDIFLNNYLTTLTPELLLLIDVVDMKKFQYYINGHSFIDYCSFTFWKGVRTEDICCLDIGMIERESRGMLRQALINVNFLIKIFLYFHINLVKLIFFKLTCITFWLIPTIILFISALFLLFFIKTDRPNMWIWLMAKYIIIFVIIYQLMTMWTYFILYEEGILFWVGKTTAFHLPFNLNLAKLTSQFFIIFSIFITLIFYIEYYKKIILSIKPEFCSILYFLGFGCSMIFLQNDLFSFFLYFEVISFCIYGLLFLHKRTNAQLHSLIRYVLFSLWISTCYIFGLAFFLVSCKTSTSLFWFSQFFVENQSFVSSERDIYSFIQTALPSQDFNIILIQEFELFLSIIFILLYFLFKLGAGPFYSWTIEVYNASSTGSLFIISMIPKLVYFPMMFFLLFCNFIEYTILWSSLLFIIGLITVFIGSFGILLTDKLKEIYAWSSIIHTGNLLLIASTLSTASLTFMMFYLISYYLISFGFIVLITSLRNKLTGRFIKTISELNSINNLYSNFYVLAIILLASASGFTPFLSFFMKFSLLSLLSSYYGVTITIFVGLLNIIGSITYLWMLRNIIGFNLEKYYLRGSEISISFTEIKLSYTIASLFNFTILLIIFSFIFYTDFIYYFTFFNIPNYASYSYFFGIKTI